MMVSILSGAAPEFLVGRENVIHYENSPEAAVKSGFSTQL
jgi:hypothetical protein